MKSKITRADYARLEKIYLLQSKKVSALDLFRQLLSNIWHGLCRSFMVSQELKVWRTGDARGRIWWNAYDYKTGQSISYLNEDQMRIWIEKRYRS